MPTKTSIEQRLTLANIAISNALGDPSLATALASFGYTTDRLRQGGALRENALALYQQQKGAYGDLRTANDTYAAELAQAQETYMRYVKVARVALEKQRGALQKLSLAGQRKRPLAGRLAQAQQFYANALSDPAIRGQLAAFGITQAMLEAGQRQVEAVADSDAARRQRQGAARDATRARDAAMAALDDWMRDFMQVARVALRDRPQFLAKLGMPASAVRAARTSSATAGSTETPVVETAAQVLDSQPLMGDRRAGSAVTSRRNGTKLAAVLE